MRRKVQNNPSLKTRLGAATNMSLDEKQISFLNTYFIFKKVRNVDAAAVARARIGESMMEQELQEKESEAASVAVSEAKAEIKANKVTFTKLGRRVKLRVRKPK